MAKTIRKKTKDELADAKFKERASTQAEVLMRAQEASERLPKSRQQFLLDIASDGWINRFEPSSDQHALEKERRKWEKLRQEFLKSVDKPLEIHCFTCNYNASRGIKPLLSLVKHPLCDAGTALRLFWINDPVYYSRYTTISECPYEEERDAIKLINAIKRRFKNNDFQSRKIYFDPQPWMESDDVDLNALDLPPLMLAPVP